MTFQLVESEFKLPLLEVRPQSCGILRNLPVDEPQSEPPLPGHVPSPYFKDCLDPEKSFITGIFFLIIFKLLLMYSIIKIYHLMVFVSVVIINFLLIFLQKNF